MTTAIVTQKLRSTTPVTVFDTATTAAVANAAGAISSAISNETNGDQVASFELNVPVFAVAPTAGQSVDMFFVQNVDGTNDEDGSATVFPQIPVWSFSTRASASLRQVSPPLLLPPRDFKVIIRNASAQTMNAGWGLKMLAVSDQANW